MNNNKLLKIVIVGSVIFVLLGFWFMFGRNKPSNSKEFSGDFTVMPEANASTEEITGNIVIEQSFISNLDRIDKVALVFTRLYQPEKDAYIAIELADGQNVIGYKRIKVDEIEAQHRTFVDVNSDSNLKNKELKLRIYSDTETNTGMALMMRYDDSVSFMFGNMTINGTICFNVSGN